MEHDAEYYSKKWTEVIKGMPVGGQYRFDIRKHGYKLAIDEIPEGSKVFDYACGLGVIDQMLIEKDCVVSGCDFSPVAVEYCKKETGGDFRTTGDIFGKHDVVIAAYFLEHIVDPDKWVEMALEHAPRVICHLPRNFSHHGEHIDMGWTSWSNFKEVFNEFDFIRLDTHDKNDIDTMDDAKIKYPKIGQFAHPIIEFRKKGGFNASKKNKTKSERKDKSTRRSETTEESQEKES
jgi:hypothetical protein